ncbi:hypothetical protein ACNTMW_20160 [Planosporangium sp. 12N6]|uniref:hypothetical protein n=1 Tax=Planosporangium spinosum TaxID=3402278 RepID=UPI003CF47962
MQTIGPYRVLRPLGSCQAGKVWLGADAAGREATIAVLDAAVARDDQWRQAFGATGRSLAAARAIRVVNVDLAAPAPWLACAPDVGQGAVEVFTALGQEYHPVTEDARGDSPSPAPTVGSATGRPAAPGSGSGYRPPGGWVGVLALLILLPGVGSGIIASTIEPRGVAATSSGSPPTRTTPTPFVTPSPTRPGVEPPREGTWPAAWPTFGSADTARTLPKLPGLDRSFQVPATWRCDQAARATGFARYTCTDTSDTSGADNRTGGELLVRDCPQPCDSNRRVQLRRAEEAWGLQWVRAGSYTSWAETGQLDGAPRYGLVFVAYWRSAPDGPIDREVVLRMSGPPDRVNDIRKIANSIRREIT